MEEVICEAKETKEVARRKRLRRHCRFEWLVKTVSCRSHPAPPVAGAEETGHRRPVPTLPRQKTFAAAFVPRRSCLMHATVSSVLSTRHKLAPMHDCYRLGAPRNSRATIAAPSGASAVAMVTLSTLTSTCVRPLSRSAEQALQQGHSDSGRACRRRGASTKQCGALDGELSGRVRS